jgi:hypothetical protein
VGEIIKIFKIVFDEIENENENENGKKFHMYNSLFFPSPLQLA